MLATSVCETLAKPAARASRVEPSVLMRDGTLEGCGLVAHFETEGQRVRIDLNTLRRGGGTVFLLAGQWATSSGASEPIADLALASSRLDTRSAFGPASTTADGGISMEGALDQVAGALFIQSVMVGGARIELLARNGARLHLEIAGPLPQSVRASYLNCSGDLYRP
ncbi:MAG: hypothetical protein NW205_12860 [Hyphomicrobiaceae bacterium]|nr:hypothetical protein [Hyphomicrobiaceae bacterium]